MIYLATFFLTLFLTHVARAVPRGCHDVVSSETDTNQHDFAYGDALVGPPPSPLKATFDQTFDNPNGLLNNVACSDGKNGLSSRFRTFGDIPGFPYIGGAYDIVWNSTNCGSCWRLTNTANNFVIYITAIDTAGAGFNIAKQAFSTLSNGDFGSTLIVKAQKVSSQPC